MSSDDAGGITVAGPSGTELATHAAHTGPASLRYGHGLTASMNGSFSNEKPGASQPLPFKEERRKEESLEIQDGILPGFHALTRAVHRGDADAFSCLYDVYSFRVYRFLLVLAHGDEDQAREVCQTVFIKLAKRCDVFDNEQKFWAWLCVLARNAFVDQYRARQRLSRFVSLEESAAEPSSTVDSDHRLNQLIHEALAALPRDEQELLQAAYVDKRPLGDLAEEAGQSYKALESRLARLRQKLKAKLLKDLRHEN